MKFCKHCNQEFSKNNIHWLIYLDKRFGILTYKCKIYRQFIRQKCATSFEQFKELYNYKKLRKDIPKQVKKAQYDKLRKIDPSYSEYRKLIRKRYNSSEKGKACIKRQNEKRVSTPLGSLEARLRSYLNVYIKRQTGKLRYLSYKVEDLIQHLQSKFQPGMTWDNRSEWHIDHIIPLKYKNLDGSYYWNQEELADPTSETFKKAWSLNNLQPLWAKENIKKSNKWC